MVHQVIFPMTTLSTNIKEEHKAQGALITTDQLKALEAQVSEWIDSKT